MLKTISCGDVRAEHVGKTVTLAGWVHRRRDHGGLIFIDLRDREGIVQVVFNPDNAPDGVHAVAESLRNEWVVQVSGDVSARPEGTENPNLPTGEIEVAAEQVKVLNESKTPPFYINEESEVDELIRMKYRFLDLRRESMRDIIIMRHEVVRFIRDFLSERGFLEVETPILIKSTPEGARDYLVPSRLYPGKFYALPQSPQQLKQLLMAAGVEKYFQIARCFRDEDPRADRQPEHTQLDLEMSFVEEDDVLNLIEELYTKIIEALFPDKWIMRPFPRMTYAEAMASYGSDKPDLRFDLDMADLSDIAAQTEFRVFTSVVAGGGIVKGFSAPGVRHDAAPAAGRAHRVRQGERSAGARDHRANGRGRDGRPDGSGLPLAGCALPQRGAGQGYRSQGGSRHGRHDSHRGGAREDYEPGAERAPQRDGQAAGTRGPEPNRVRVRNGLPAVRVERGRRALGRDAPCLFDAEGRA